MKRNDNYAGYEDRFEKYLNGGLEPGEAEEIESDIEKFQVLFSHLDQALDQELYGRESKDEAEGEDGTKGKDEEFSRKIAKAVNKKLRNYMIAAVVIAVCIIPALLACLSSLFDRLYYNPCKSLEIVDEENDSVIVTNPFAAQMCVYMELFCGDKGFAEVVSWREGYGRYSIDVRTQIDGENTSHMLELVRNHLYRNDFSWNCPDFPENAFTYGNAGISCSMGKNDAVEKLSDIPDSMHIRTAVSFSETKSMEELAEFMAAYDTNYLYCPVVVEGWGGYWGFAPEKRGYDLTDCYDQEKYPYLDICQYDPADKRKQSDEKEREEGTGAGGNRVPAEVYEKHLESMIRYLMDQEDFLKIFDSGVPGENVADLYKYRTALDYIQEYGVKSYGTVVYATKQELLEMLEDPSVDGVYMLDGKIDLKD